MYQYVSHLTERSWTLCILMPRCKIYCCTSLYLLCQTSIFNLSNLKVPNTSILSHPLKTSFQWHRYWTDSSFSWYITSFAMRTRQLLLLGKKMSIKSVFFFSFFFSILLLNYAFLGASICWLHILLPSQPRMWHIMIRRFLTRCSVKESVPRVVNF